MSASFTRDRITTGYGLVPNGLWTLGTTHGAKVLLGWLHSHSDEFLAGLTVNGCRRALGSAAVLTWLIELERLGFIEIARGEKGTRSRFHLLGEPWVALQNRSETGSPTDPKLDRSQSNPGSVTGPKQDHIEEQLEQPSQDNQTPLPPASGGMTAIDASFDAFWSLYPRKTGKPAAKRKYRTAYKAAFPAAILDGLDRWVIHWRQARTEMQFIPHPATWLNQERWNDPCPNVVLMQPRDRARAALEAMVQHPSNGGQHELG